ncbi:hypothetical protein QE152_g1108 [Popillia japonica]|uniref:DDE Tnp4 domain-containing protein n=1 Tax=Popillia japonica TaxID=7064 RepID=A0AAW1N9H6_POPJA
MGDLFIEHFRMSRGAFEITINKCYTKHLTVSSKFYSTGEENSVFIMEIVRVFYERSNGFPGIVGAIDGCHIPIKQPTQNPRKHFHSIILQGICDHRMVFMDI